MTAGPSAATLPGLSFKPRDLHFDLEAVPRFWHGGSAHITRLFDALSLFFPHGERFFIDSLRPYRAGIAADSLLASQVRAFVGQEALHSREHHAYNLWLDRQGVGARVLETATAQRLELLKRATSQRRRLAITLCLEHFTAILADQVLDNPAVLQNAHPQMRRLWRWHALEETEHKAVAFDVYEQAFGRGLKAWALRCSAMFGASFFFVLFTWLYLLRLVRRDGQLWNIAGWWALLRFVFIKPAPFVRILPAWASWFRPRFHPWQHDNSHLIRQTRAEYETTSGATV
jgi:predicted metal-dependent hydrolase